MERKSRLAQREAKYGYLFISPWLLGFLMFVIIPIIASLYLSFTNYELFKPGTSWIGFKNYIELLTQDRLFWLSLYNTVYYTVFSVPLGIGVALILALLLNRKLYGVTIYRTIFYLPSVTSGVALSLLWVWLFNPTYGLINVLLGKIGIQGPGWISDPKWAKPAFILMSLWGVGGTMVILLAGLQGVPEQLYEAAELDGANWWQKFRHVTFPMISPVIFFNLIMGIIGAFQYFTQAYVMTGGGPVDSTLFYVLYLFRQGFLLLRMGYASAMAWLLFIVILLLTIIQFKLASYWVYYEAEGR
jgi:multiple sugar transport system permease protein